jgi:hypothetical protein
MRFYSILYRTPDDEAERRSADAAPEYFVDLALDQIVTGITAGREAYRLEADFQLPLSDPDAILYRQEVVRELQRDGVYDAVTSFADAMVAMRERLAARDAAHYRYQRDRWFLEAILTYVRAVRGLTAELGATEPRSRGISGLLAYLGRLTSSDAFMSLAAGAEDLRTAIDEIVYDVLIQGNTVKVRTYAGEADYSAQVLATFEKFETSAPKDYRAKFRDHATMNHVEAQILDAVARLHPDTFARLHDFCQERRDFLDDRIAAFDREAQFYLATLERVRVLERDTGLRFSLPELAPSWGGTFAETMFDAALAIKVRDEHPVVANDVRLDGDERLIVVTGPNQGGKTTFARAFGQLHYLAALGLPVPAAAARVHPFDGLYTHFEREEHVEDLRGKLHEELVRVHDLVERATNDSLVIMNEAFSSTTASDALLLSREVLRRIDARGTLGLVVTFLDELASLHERTVSMVGTVDPEDPAVRTFRIVRRPADGRAYAIAIARKYGLTRDALSERLPA